MHCVGTCGNSHYPTLCCIIFSTIVTLTMGDLGISNLFDHHMQDVSIGTKSTIVQDEEGHESPKPFEYAIEKKDFYNEFCP